MQRLSRNEEQDQFELGKEEEMRLYQDIDTGFWNQILLDVDADGVSWMTLKTHAPEDCADSEWCDVHDRRCYREAGFPLNWRTDRGMMEFVCPHGVGHPTRAQREYWYKTLPQEEFLAEIVHGCDGCCDSW